MSLKAEESREFLEQYAAAADSLDKSIVDDPSKDLDSLLVFSGLFSAVSTAFIVESYKLLQPDFTELSYYALINATQLPYSPATFVAPPNARVVNGLWISSLIVSLFVALFGILAKQWLLAYSGWREPSPRNWALLRQYRLDSSHAWRLYEFIAILPMILHVSLFLFLAGLVVFLSTIDRVISIITLALSAATAFLYVAATLSPLIKPSSPYRSFFTVVIQQLGLAVATALRLPKRLHPTCWRQDPWFVVTPRQEPRRFACAVAWLCDSIDSPRSSDAVLEALQDAKLVGTTFSVLSSALRKKVVAVAEDYIYNRQAFEHTIAAYLRAVRPFIAVDDLPGFLWDLNLPKLLQSAYTRDRELLPELVHEASTALLSLHNQPGNADKSRSILCELLSSPAGTNNSGYSTAQTRTPTNRISTLEHFDTIALDTLTDDHVGDLLTTTRLLSDILSLRVLAPSHECWLRLASDINSSISAERVPFLRVKDGFYELQSVIKQFCDAVQYQPGHFPLLGR